MITFFEKANFTLVLYEGTPNKYTHPSLLIAESYHKKLTAMVRDNTAQLIEPISSCSPVSKPKKKKHTPNREVDIFTVFWGGWC